MYSKKEMPSRRHGVERIPLRLIWLLVVLSFLGLLALLDVLSDHPPFLTFQLAPSWVLLLPLSSVSVLGRTDITATTCEARKQPEKRREEE